MIVSRSRQPAAAEVPQDERTLDFDCTRIYYRLEDKLELGPGIDQVTVEVQIRTILQHDWSKLTHPLVYKANMFDAKAGRLAAELMAHLESIDRSFSHFRTNSRSVKEVNRRDMVGSSSVTARIDQLVADGIIPSELRPSNGRRLGENASDRRGRGCRASGNVRTTSKQRELGPLTRHPTAL